MCRARSGAFIRRTKNKKKRSFLGHYDDVWLEKRHYNGKTSPFTTLVHQNREKPHQISRFAQFSAIFSKNLFFWDRGVHTLKNLIFFGERLFCNEICLWRNPACNFEEWGVLWSILKTKCKAFPQVLENWRGVLQELAKTVVGRCCRGALLATNSKDRG